MRINSGLYQEKNLRQLLKTVSDSSIFTLPNRITYSKTQTRATVSRSSESYFHLYLTPACRAAFSPYRRGYAASP